MARSYVITVEVGKICKSILTLVITSDGSISLQDRIIKQNSDDLMYRYIQMQFPANKVGAGKSIVYDGPWYFSKNKPKLSHHAPSGKFHISSALNDQEFKILSGFTEEGDAKGLGNQSTHLTKETNDGGPIMAGLFFGLNKMPTARIKSSEEIIFTTSYVDDQCMTIRCGKRLAVAVLIFHFIKTNNNLKYIDGDWARYSHRLYKKPVLVRIIDPGDTHNFLIGVACMRARLNDESEYGYRMGGGPGIVDQDTGECLNTDILFEIPTPQIPSNAICLDYPVE